MSRSKYVVKLGEVEREQVFRLIRNGKSLARIVLRGHVLAKADEGWADGHIADAFNTSSGTVYRTKKRFVEEGLVSALRERPRRGRPRKLDEKGETHLIVDHRIQLLANAG